MKIEAAETAGKLDVAAAGQAARMIYDCVDRRLCLDGKSASASELDA